MEKILLAKRHIADSIGDIIEKNFDDAGPALHTGGKFTALLEAYKAVEIAEEREKETEQRAREIAYSENMAD